MKITRNPLQAFIMALLVPGWGQVYVGRIKLGLCVPALIYLLASLLGGFGLLASPLGIYVFISLIFSIKLVAAIAAAVQARRCCNLASVPSIRFHVVFVVLIAFTVAVFLGVLRGPLLGYQLYFIPSGSMAPTVSAGDSIVSDTRVGLPEIGDIVVYRYNGTENVKRVAGLPGDTLAIIDGELIRNGENLGLFHAPVNRVKYDYSRQLAPLNVKPGHVYLLGDNRDVSNDSRFMGQVEIENITGRVTGILYSEDRSRIGVSFP